MLYFRRIKLIYILMPLFLTTIFSCDNKAKDETLQVSQEVITMKVPPIENKLIQNQSSDKAKSEANIQEKIKLDSVSSIKENTNSVSPISQMQKSNENESKIDIITKENTTNTQNSISSSVSNSVSKNDSEATKPTISINSSSSDTEPTKEQTKLPANLDSQTSIASLSTNSNAENKTISSQSNSVVLNNEANVSVKPEEISSEISEEKLFYIAKGKTDPFEPLIKDKPPVEEVKESFEEDVPERILTPLEKLDFGQMKLVAILTRESGSVAMVQEATGKGYIVNIGTYMGRNSGQVISIEKDKLVIQEKVKDYKGNMVDRFQELKLNKLDDKG
ncbi:MAG: pilus assembly protein PilP [Desulfamplus sp.]|nr:pilus assembly protein PilP [Desulfamplus sp.]